MNISPTLLATNGATIEVSVHRCPDALRRDLKHVFSPTDSIDYDKLWIVPTFQPSQHDLVAMGSAVEEEKDRLLQQFIEWADPIVTSLGKAGQWADYTDPVSGYPMHGERGASPYPDVHGSQVLLKYPLFNAGSCSVITHPRWRTRCYPATLFSTAPLEDLCTAIGIPVPTNSSS